MENGQSVMIKTHAVHTCARVEKDQRNEIDCVEDSDFLALLGAIIPTRSSFDITSRAGACILCGYLISGEKLVSADLQSSFSSVARFQKSEARCSSVVR